MITVLIVALIAILFVIPIFGLSMMFHGCIGVYLVRNEKPPLYRPNYIYRVAKKQLNFSPHRGWPRAANLFYECQICHTSIPSLPKIMTHCACGNLFVDSDIDRIGAQKPSEVILLEIGDL